jgi:hypothetical protein
MGNALLPRCEPRIALRENPAARARVQNVKHSNTQPERILRASVFVCELA